MWCFVVNWFKLIYWSDLDVIWWCFCVKKESYLFLSWRKLLELLSLNEAGVYRFCKSYSFLVQKSVSFSDCYAVYHRYTLFDFFKLTNWVSVLTAKLCLLFDFFNLHILLIFFGDSLALLWLWFFIFCLLFFVLFFVFLFSFMLNVKSSEKLWDCQHFKVRSEVDI